MSLPVDGISLIHEKMLEILKKIDDICQNNDISYFLDGGSSIGAIRHKGFIPWDDDIDISLLKEDYLHLLELIKNDKDFYLYFDDFTHHCCSFVYCKSEIWQSANDSYFPNLYPVKLDIRPINKVKNTPEAIRENYLYRNIAEYLLFNKSELPVEEIILKIKEFGGKDNFLNFYNKEYGILPNDDNVVLAHPYLTYSKPVTFPLDYISSTRRVPFENIEVSIPKTDEMLRYYYGDYMVLPPESERISYSKAVYRVSKGVQNYLCNLYQKVHKRQLTFIDKLMLRLLMFLFSKKLKNVEVSK